MKICLVHNRYGSYSGEERVVEQQARLLADRGHTVTTFFRDSALIGKGFWPSVEAFFSGIYSRRSQKAFERLLDTEKPDMVHVHNLFPLISPSILFSCRHRVPIVMTVHNYRLICPIGLLFTNGQNCQRCTGDGGELWCLVKNCTGQFTKSLGYALRNTIARKGRFFQKNVSKFCCLSRFQADLLVEAGFPASKMRILGNFFLEDPGLVDGASRDCVGFLGRLSPEKGLHVLRSAAARFPNIPFLLAGGGYDRNTSKSSWPANVTFLGSLDPSGLDGFFRKCRLLVVPSLWNEPFGMVIIEAMVRGLPVLASRIGGIPEIVIDGLNGVLFQPGDLEDFTEKLNHLYFQPSLCEEMGLRARNKTLEDFSPNIHYARLMEIYREAQP